MRARAGHAPKLQTVGLILKTIFYYKWEKKQIKHLHALAVLAVKNRDGELSECHMDVEMLEQKLKDTKLQVYWRRWMINDNWWWD